MLQLKLLSLIKSLIPLVVVFMLKIYFRETGVKSLIDFTQSNDKSWQSVFLMTLMIAALQFFTTVSLSLAELLQSIEGSKLIQDLQMKVLRKSLKININDQLKYTRSRVSLMINQDCKKFDTYYHNLAFVIIVPLQIFHSIYVLQQRLGWYWIIVTSSLLIVFVISFRLSKYTLIYRKKGQEQTHERSSLIQGVSESMRYVKGQNYEDVFYKKLDDIREKELGFINKMTEMINFKHYLIKLSQPITMSIILLYYVFIDVQTIDITLIFILEQAFWAVRQGLGIYPKFLSSFTDQKVLLKEIKIFLNLKEIDNSQIIEREDKIVLQIEGQANNSHNLSSDNAHQSFKEITNNQIESNTNLIEKKKQEGEIKSKIDKNYEGIKLNLDINIGEVVVVKGPTGSGKSYLLKSLLGEYGGVVQSERKIAYVGQDNWLQNKSIKENIILDREYDEEWFQLVVKCFELDKDFSDLEYIITSSCDNISGGQKQRINLARAFYARNCNLILLDDSFCSLDRRVMKQILTNIFKYFRPHRKLIFAINENLFIEQNATILIELSQDHAITNITKLSPQNISFQDHSNQQLEQISANLHKALGKRLIEYKHEKIQLGQSPNPNNDTKEKNQNNANNDVKSEKKQNIVTNGMKVKDQNQGLNQFLDCMKKYISVDRIIGIYLVLALVSIALYSVFYFCEYYILMNWNTLSISQNNKIFIYLLLDILNNIAQIFRIYFSKVQGLYASKKIHQLASSTLLNANYQLYLQETITPHKFQDLLTTQIQGIDFDLSSEMTRIFFQSFQIINAIFLTLWGSFDDPVTIIGLGLFMYYGFQIAQKRVNNQQEIQIKIKESNQPVIGYVNECLLGVEYIRVFQMQKDILDRFNYLQESNSKWFELQATTAFQNDLKFSTLSFFLNFASIYSSLMSESPQTVIPKVTSNSQIDQNTMTGVKCFNNIFIQLISFSYVIDFLNQIKDYQFNQSTTHQSSVQNTSNGSLKFTGQIDLINYSAYYNEKKEPNRAALNNINLTIHPGQKVCVVGRTGSGKTSLILSLLKLIHFENGKIKFDGNQLEGTTIRDNISVIQQESIVMKGTLKDNIDPISQYASNEKLWDQIVKLNINEILTQNSMDLSMKIEEQGKNLSAGQKQIVSLVRALIQDKPIILFDEANSNLDENNENLMQEILLNRKATIIFIAHKIKHINQFDRVLYLDCGHIAEDGSPQQLLSIKDSKFFNLYNSQS